MIFQFIGILGVLFLYFFLFNIVALPMKITFQPLKLLTIIWGVILILITVAFLLLRQKQNHRNAQHIRSIFAGKEKYATLLLFILILVQTILYNLNDEAVIWDQGYYLGDTAASLYTNTISQYDPYTGRLLNHLNTEYLLETYQNHSSVMCQLLGIHPMIENLTVMASVVIILYYLIFLKLVNACSMEPERKVSCLLALSPY